jgi:hypothetical protein
MTTHPLAVSFTEDDAFTVELNDGRRLTVPLSESLSCWQRRQRSARPCA